MSPEEGDVGPGNAQRRRAAQEAEILATADWDHIMRDTNCPAASLIPDDSFAAYKSIYTKRGGKDAPWSGDTSPNISDRIATRGTVAYAAYHGLKIPKKKLPELTAEQQAKIDARLAERRRNR